MALTLEQILKDEELRRREFPVVQEQVFFAHAGVSPLPRVAADALKDFAEAGSRNQQEAGSIWRNVERTRVTAAKLLHAQSSEIALLGPTSLGLNLVANGLEWKSGDEVVYYQSDYPANVYPWLHLASKGVKPVSVKPEKLGQVTWESVEGVLTEKTRLVSLASASFMTGWRLDIPKIGSELHKRGILFSVDGIQTLGAFPTTVEHVDFLSADAHKWLLGPVAAGIFYVRESLFEKLRPSLLGSWNVVSPNFIAQEKIEFYPGARRYEPGTLNMPGIVGMLAAMELLMEVGIENVAARVSALRVRIAKELLQLGFELVPDESALDASNYAGILSVRHKTIDVGEIAKKLMESNVTLSARHASDGGKLLRISPHFYNTEEEVEKVIKLIKTLIV